MSGSARWEPDALTVARGNALQGGVPYAPGDGDRGRRRGDAEGNPGVGRGVRAVDHHLARHPLGGHAALPSEAVHGGAQA